MAHKAKMANPTLTGTIIVILSPPQFYSGGGILRGFAGRLASAFPDECRACRSLYHRLMSPYDLTGKASSSAAAGHVLVPQLEKRVGRTRFLRQNRGHRPVRGTAGTGQSA